MDDVKDYGNGAYFWYRAMHGHIHTHTLAKENILKTLSSNSFTHTHSFYLVACQMSKHAYYNYNENYVARCSGIEDQISD